MDSKKLAKITPGVTRLEEKEQDSFQAVADINIGPVKGSFEGQLNIEDKVEHESFSLKITQNSKIGNVKADVDIKLEELEGGETEMSFEGKAHFSGLLARTGARVMTGLANSITKQFFSALSEELN